MTIYEQMKNAGIETGNHCSDLYAKVTPVSKNIISQYIFKKNIKIFVNQIDKTLWYDIPFAYLPYWENNSYE